MRFAPHRLFFWLFALALLLTPAAVVADPKIEPFPDPTPLCKHLSENFFTWATSNGLLQASAATVHISSFYSRKYKACIHTEVAQTVNSFTIRDVSESIFREGTPMLALFICTSKGVNQAKIDVVIKRRGLVGDLQDHQWMDNGEGGAPATVVAPAQPPTKAKCRLLFDRMIAQLRE